MKWTAVKPAEAMMRGGGLESKGGDDPYHLVAHKDMARLLTLLIRLSHHFHLLLVPDNRYLRLKLISNASAKMNS
ncbi:unnamed protein product [Dovyalis caffra]|uniref:Uncharacterized protein n=1 Tax=Dovyalis caffra TaxID=77055 RepID=A0AAV1RCA8_9ROSI|nr:unnamed protein product [Dovyalis caffra]